MKKCNLATNLLKPTEKIIPSRLKNLISILGLDTKSWPRIIVSNEYLILDGHHRHRIALEHKLQFVPVTLIDYYDEDVQVFGYQNDIVLDKCTLMHIYKSGTILEPKTTRHILTSKLTDRLI